MVDSTVMQSGRYKAYPEYKDSGVEWLGEIPPHWKISKLRYMFDFGSGLNITKANLQDTGIPCISYGEIHSKFGFEVDTERHDLKFVDEKYLVSNPSALLNKGDLVFADTSEDIEGSGNFTQLLSDKPAFAGYHTVIVRPKNDDCSRFYAYLMDSKEIRTQIRYIVKGVKVFTISQSILKGVSIWLPSSEERQAIANFLDYETAKIDTLIEKQQRLIELLTEKRQAVISHAVTKGLNPDVPMKDSGVEWLGEVPEHWEVKRFKTIFKIRKRIAGELGHDVLSITQKGIKIKDTESGEGQLSMDYSKYQLVYKGDYAMNHMDLLTGFVDISKYDGVTSPDYRVFTLEEKNSLPEYFLAFLQMGYINKLFFPFGQGAAHMGRWRLPTEAFREFLAPVPPKNEQKAIADFIFNSLEQMDILEKKSRKAIKLMQERRTALISAAVTGKIDVRDWVKPE